MKLMETMERTLQQAPRTPVQTPHGLMEWPTEFRDPIDAAMHLDSAKPRTTRGRKRMVAPLPPNFFD